MGPSPGQLKFEFWVESSENGAKAHQSCPKRSENRSKTVRKQLETIQNGPKRSENGPKPSETIRKFKTYRPSRSKNPKITQKIYKKNIFAVFQNYKINTKKLHKNYIYIFAVFKITKKCTKITKKIQIAPLRGAVGIADVIFVYFFGNLENSKNVDVIFV